MRSFLWIAFGALLLQGSAPAQTAGPDTEVADVPTSTDGTVDSGTGAPTITPQEFVPMTMSERSRYYLIKAFGPGAILRSAASGGFSQLTNTPKEWHQGAQAYGDRVGSAMAEHVTREALEFGGSVALHEDNRYVHSTDTGFVKRTKHAVASVFVARNDAGSEHFAYSRFGAVLGSSFISRLGEPRSEDSAGDAMVSFGVTMASDVGWNVVKEFAPAITKHFRKH